MNPVGGVTPVITPGTQMASWSFYLGILGFIAVIVGLLVRMLALHIMYLAPTLLIGGAALGVIAVVLGLVGLLSANRAGALAGLLLGILAVAAFLIFGGVRL